MNMKKLAWDGKSVQTTNNTAIIVWTKMSFTLVNFKMELN